MTNSVLPESTLGESEARDLTAQAYRAGETFLTLVQELYVRGAHTALGYRTFASYFESEFRGMDAPRIASADRPDIVRQLTAAGMSTREVGAVVGADKRTVARDLSGAFAPGADANETPSPSADVRNLFPGGGYPPDPMDPSPWRGNFPVDEEGNILRNGEDGIGEFEDSADEVIDAELVDEEPKPKKEPMAPQASARRRRPINDQANDIGWEIRKSAERMERLLADDRFEKNRDQVAQSLRAHLVFVKESVTTALETLDL